MFILDRENLEEKNAVLVAATEEVGLWELPKDELTKWRNFYMRLREPERYGRKKRAWWFSWNGERIAGGRDALLLLEHRPETYRWLEEVLRGTKCPFKWVSATEFVVATSGHCEEIANNWWQGARIKPSEKHIARKRKWGANQYAR